MTSPRIQRLTERLAAGDQAALAEFWRDVEATGAPLIELADEPDHRLVTFVWRDRTGDTRNVLVLWGPAPYWDVASNAFERLADTDLWFKTYRVRSDHRGRYILSPNDPLTPLAKEGTAEAWERYKRFIPDPLNPREYVQPRNPFDAASIDRRYSLLELEDAPEQRWAEPRDGVPTGMLEQHTFPSRILDNERPVWVYTPPGYREGEPYPVVVLLDGRNWIEQRPVVPTLDNLLADGLIPPTVAVLVDSLDWATRSRELTCHEPFVESLTTELVPWVDQRWSVSADPAAWTLDGVSYGGLTALLTGLRRPDVFGNVIAHSPSLWWAPEGDSEREWLVREYERQPPTSVRTYLEVGLNEGPAMVPVCRRMREVMTAKGYDLTYVEYNGGHDLNCWRGGFAEAIRGFAESGASRV